MTTGFLEPLCPEMRLRFSTRSFVRGCPIMSHITLYFNIVFFLFVTSISNTENASVITFLGHLPLLPSGFVFCLHVHCQAPSSFSACLLAFSRSSIFFLRLFRFFTHAAVLTNYGHILLFHAIQATHCASCGTPSGCKILGTGRGASTQYASRVLKKY